MTKISKHYGKRTCIYDENEDRRVRCPDWSFTTGFIKRLEEGAKENKVSKSKYFESVVQNFFILENPNLIIASKRDYNQVYKKKRSPNMTLHPQIIDDINEYSSKSSPSASKYIELLFSRYNSKYGYEIELKNLLKFI
ncbi:hypothetical protein [Halarcobacter anaerophilus]|uniref:Uncharacterized protein n=1 Tax=Halarcobacter anaerophilus TaxID=877500 RepID=A0A4Q0Y4G1_9BACT|nr:hypothetical protein [Halarcobacter anaerophilus]QDF28984.1 hypothetical protein AANAER_1504 [Halarcobacter anaerophilus]RXJ63619.1 hypothetical protein CRV06_05345 [Halarcobacter anaerophilus]